MVLIIHISGVPASGKTTLLKKLATKFKSAFCFDTDLLLQTNTKEFDDLIKIKNNIEYSKKKLEMIKFALDYIIKNNSYKYDTFIFSGILIGALYDHVFEWHIECTKLYLDTPVELVLERYYSRMFENINKKTKKEKHEFYRLLSEKDYFAYIQSSDAIVDSHASVKESHKLLGYQCMTAEEIIKKLSELIANKVKQ